MAGLRPDSLTGLRGRGLGKGKGGKGIGRVREGKGKRETKKGKEEGTYVWSITFKLPLLPMYHNTPRHCLSSCNHSVIYCTATLFCP